MCVSLIGCEEKENTLVIAGDKDVIESTYFKTALSLYKNNSNTDITVIEYSDSAITDPSVDVIIHPIEGALLESGFEGFYDMSHQPWINEIEGYALKTAVFDNKIYGFPMGQSTVTGCFYNMEVLKKYELSVPTTQNEFDTLCDTLAGKGIIPIYVAGADLHPLRYDLVIENSLSKRINYVDELNSGDITMSEIPGVSSMMDWWKTGADSGWFGSGWYDAKYDEAAFHIGEGFAAMIICDSNWIYNNLSSSYQYTSRDFGLMPVFMGAESGFAVCSPLPIVCVKQESAETTIALDFVKTLADRKMYNLYYDGVRTIPFLKNQNTINQPVQFASFNTEYICSISDLCGRLENFDQTKGATAIMQYTKGEIGLEVALHALTNKTK